MEYARKTGHTLVRLYADEGLSGTKIRRRKEFQQMMLDAERGLFEQVVVKDISRLARNTVDLLQSVRRLKALGIETVFLTANMTSMGDSEFILTVFGALAQEESANISKRVKFGKRMNAEKGRVPNLVYGYDKTNGDYFNLRINPGEAAVIRQIYRWYIEDGCGTGRISNLLNQRGLKTKRGCSWSQNAVRRILTNPIYTGEIVNGKQEVSDFLTSARVSLDSSDWLVTDRPDLRIIGEPQFRQAAGILSSRGRAFRLDRRRHSGKHLFSTLIRCKECGRSFRRTARTYQNTYVRWVCSRHNGQGAGSCPNAAAVDENELVACLDEYFLRLLNNRKQVSQLIRQALKRACREQDGSDGRRRAVVARLAKLEKQRQTYLDLYTDSLITRQELDRKLSSSGAELALLETEQRRMEALSPDDAAMDRMVNLIFQDLPSFASVRNLNNAQLKQLISRIEVDKDGNVDVYLRFLSAARSPASPLPLDADSTGPEGGFSVSGALIAGRFPQLKFTFFQISANPGLGTVGGPPFRVELPAAVPCLFLQAVSASSTGFFFNVLPPDKSAGHDRQWHR